MVEVDKAQSAQTLKRKEQHTMAALLREWIERYLLLAIALGTVYHYVVPVLHQIQDGVSQVVISAMGGR